MFGSVKGDAVKSSVKLAAAQSTGAKERAVLKSWPSSSSEKAFADVLMRGAARGCAPALGLI